MNYVKKMCILRQIKQGFSGDGKTLSGLIKVEQYGKNLAVEVSIINFAPLVSGEYYCLLSDGNGKTEMLALRGKSLFNILSDIDITHGFCAIICYAKTEVVPIAYGVNGNGSYDWKRILGATLPPVFPIGNQETEVSVSAETTMDTPYDDDNLASDNYFTEMENEQIGIRENNDDASVENTNQEEDAHARSTATENANDKRVRQAFTTDGDGYYRSVKDELDELMRTYPKDDTLRGAFGCSEWVRIKGEKERPEYLVGVLYDGGLARYICYALRAENPEQPPEEIREVCSFVPLSPLLESVGYFVIFQSATTGECVKPTTL